MCRLLLIYFLCLSTILVGQKVKGKFSLRILPDNFWYFTLDKKGKYEYYFSSFAKTYTLEKGTYKIERNIISFKADSLNKKQTLENKKFKIYKIELGERGKIPSFSPHSRISKNKYWVLTPSDIDSVILFTKPLDTISTTKLYNQSLVNYILTIENIKQTDSVASTFSSWSKLYSENEVELIGIDNGDNLLKIYLRCGKLVHFYTSQINITKSKILLKQSLEKKEIDYVAYKKLRRLINQFFKLRKKKEILVQKEFLEFIKKQN